MIHKKKFSIVCEVRREIQSRSVFSYEIAETTDNISKIVKGSIALFEYEGITFILKGPDKYTSGWSGLAELTITHSGDDILNFLPKLMATRPYSSIPFSSLSSRLNDHCKRLIIEDIHSS